MLHVQLQTVYDPDHQQGEEEKQVESTSIGVIVSCSRLAFSLFSDVDSITGNNNWFCHFSRIQFALAFFNVHAQSGKNPAGIVEPADGEGV